MEVNFQHWEYEIPSELLTRYGSPHFSEAEAGRALVPRLLSSAHMVSQCAVSFRERHILCANEAFPEAAIADPLADLRVWDEWCNGSRRFPYPGRFSRLGLTHQEKKTSSPSSVGVLGEILAGIFSQSYVSPQVVVRCIRRWPDLIFYVGGDIYSFVEAKAYTGARMGVALHDRVTEPYLRELMYAAVHQLNADPHLDVWGAFTGVVEMEPDFVSTVTMVRLKPPEARREMIPRAELPLAVVRGVAERAVAQAALRLPAEDLHVFSQWSPQVETQLVLTTRHKMQRSRREVEAHLKEVAGREVEVVLAGSAPKVAIEGSRKLIETEISRLIRGYQPSQALIGRRFFEIKSEAEPCVLQKVRRIGNDWLFMADLGEVELAKIEGTWQPDWERAPNALTICDGAEVYRCGGAAYCYGHESLEYRSVRV